MGFFWGVNFCTKAPPQQKIQRAKTSHVSTRIIIDSHEVLPSLKLTVRPENQWLEDVGR